VRNDRWNSLVDQSCVARMTSTMQPGADNQGLASPPSTTLRRPAELERTVYVSGLVDADGGLLVREPEWVTQVDADLDRVPGT
jgi:hypothetical protein